jgi:hypothetical protein
MHDLKFSQYFSVDWNLLVYNNNEVVSNISEATTSNFRVAPKGLNFMKETVTLYKRKAGYAPNITTMKKSNVHLAE